MIQRIQTLFLIIALSVWAAVYFLPFATVSGTGEIITIKTPGIFQSDAESVKMISSNILLIVLFIFVFLLQIITIFLFKNRPLQMRICLFTSFFQAFFMIIAIFFVFKAVPKEGQITMAWGFSAILPVCAAILNILAYRYIKKDEKLIRSVDRLR